MNSNEVPQVAPYARQSHPNDDSVAFQLDRDGTSAE
jgi:hypothetical protein